MSNEFSGKRFSQYGYPERGSIEVCRWPDRKQVALSIAHGSSVGILAYFRSDACAQQFVDWMGGISDSGGDLAK